MNNNGQTERYIGHLTFSPDPEFNHCPARNFNEKLKITKMKGSFWGSKKISLRMFDFQNPIFPGNQFYRLAKFKKHLSNILSHIIGVVGHQFLIISTKGACGRSSSVLKL